MMFFQDACELLLPMIAIFAACLEKAYNLKALKQGRNDVFSSQIFPAKVSI